MPLITIVITLIVVGVLLWLVNTYVPMDAKIKQVLNVVVLICVILWILNLFLGGGALNAVNNVRVGPVH
jgi:hypothetical protein